MAQSDLLLKLKRGEITVSEFIESSDDPSLEKYKLTKEEFLSNSKISQNTKEHELKHASVYEEEGMEVEFYYFGENAREAASAATKESLIKWLDNKSSENYIDLMKRVLNAPKELGYTDKKLLDILSI